MKDWIVHRWGLTKEAKEFGVNRVPYLHWVEGLNLNKNEPFFWIIPNLFDPNYSDRYDLTDALEVK